MSLREGTIRHYNSLSASTVRVSSRVATRVSWSALSGLKGVQPPLPFGERTGDCSPGHAGNEGPQVARTGASQGFPRAAAPVGVFSRGTTRISGSLSCGAREVRSACAWRGGARPKKKKQLDVWRTLSSLYKSNMVEVKRGAHAVDRSMGLVILLKS